MCVAYTHARKKEGCQWSAAVPIVSSRSSSRGALTIQTQGIVYSEVQKYVMHLSNEDNGDLEMWIQTTWCFDLMWLRF